MILHVQRCWVLNESEKTKVGGQTEAPKAEKVLSKYVPVIGEEMSKNSEKIYKKSQVVTESFGGGISKKSYKIKKLVLGERFASLNMFLECPFCAKIMVWS
jgi:hypothetical protein